MKTSHSHIVLFFALQLYSGPGDPARRTARQFEIPTHCITPIHFHSETPTHCLTQIHFHSETPTRCITPIHFHFETPTHCLTPIHFYSETPIHCLTPIHFHSEKPTHCITLIHFHATCHLPLVSEPGIVMHWYMSDDPFASGADTHARRGPWRPVAGGGKTQRGAAHVGREGGVEQAFRAAGAGVGSGTMRQGLYQDSVHCGAPASLMWSQCLRY